MSMTSRLEAVFDHVIGSRGPWDVRRRAGVGQHFKLRLDVGCRRLQRRVVIVGFAVCLLQLDVMASGAGFVGKADDGQDLQGVGQRDQLACPYGARWLLPVTRKGNRVLGSAHEIPEVT